MELWDAVNAEFACECSETTICKWTLSNGAVQFVRQCARCGAKSQALPHASIPYVQRLKAPDLDLALQESWEACKLTRYRELKADDKAGWDEAYQVYLASPEWNEKRAEVLKRDRYLCQGCRKAPATVVHHLTYERQGREMLFDLISLCRSCHQSIHGTEE